MEVRSVRDAETETKFLEEIFFYENCHKLYVRRYRISATLI